MKTKINSLTRLGMVFSLTALMALTPGQASAHGGNGGGGGGGGGHHGGGFYSTVSTVSELVSDINYVNTTGGAFTINLAPGTTFTLSGPSGMLPTIAAGVDLTILGNSDTLTRVDTYDRRTGLINDDYSLFGVASGASLTIEDLTLTNGAAQVGGAIANGGTLTLGNCTLTGNFAGFGVGLYNGSGGTATINDSTISDNYAVSDGAGIENDGGTLTINNSFLSGNSALYGGAINIHSGTVVVNDSIISGNTARFFVYNGSGGYGGGIFVEGGTLTISGSVVSDNEAGISGGGLFIYSGGTATVENYSSITGNPPSDDVDNLGLLYTDGTCDLGIFDGNSPIAL